MTDKWEIKIEARKKQLNFHEQNEKFLHEASDSINIICVNLNYPTKQLPNLNINFPNVDVDCLNELNVESNFTAFFMTE